MSGKENFLEDRIDLRDYLRVIVKRKWIILGIVCVGIFTALLVSFTLPEVYQASVTIQNGFIEEPLIKNSEAQEMIKSDYFLAPVVKKLVIENDIEKLKNLIKFENIEGADYFKLKVEYQHKNKDIVLKFWHAVADAYVECGNLIYQQRSGLINRYIKELDNQINFIKSDNQDIRGIIKSYLLKKEGNEAEISYRISFQQNILTAFQADLTSLLSQKNNLELTIMKSKDFKIIDFPYESQVPIRPNKKRNIIIAGFISLAFAMCYVFFSEYWQRVKTT